MEDLYRRGERVIRESIGCGVTSMRAHVEVDSIVGFACLDVAEALRDKYKMICEVQIVGKVHGVSYKLLNADRTI